MPKFFISPADTDGKRAVVRGDDAAHITKSLRMRAGERLTLCDGAGHDYLCTVEGVGTEVLLAIDEVRPSRGEPPYRAVVYQALSKGDKFDTVVQKSVECGAAAIVPVQTEWATVRLTAADCEKKRARWQKIAASAASQCGRGIVPEVMPLMSFAEAVDAAARADVALICYEDERRLTMREALAGFTPAGGEPFSVSVMIGPEGGFSGREIASAAEKLKSVTLGERILRTESAAPFALACLSMAYEM